MPDFEKVLNALKAVLKMIFGEEVPPRITLGLGYVLAGLGILAGLWAMLHILSKIKKLWVEDFWPVFYNAEEKRRIKRRQQFADYLEGEIRRLNSLESWSDYRFAELEAEVEAEGRRRIYGLFFSRTQSGLRRERSLSRALEASQERLILLEGDPGAGKSVALRHVTQSMAQRAMKSRKTKCTIPIYINLKELERRKTDTIDRNLIAAFILQSLNRVNDRDIEEFLEQEFERGLEEGTWLFLFDSFDELPEVLSSTEADTIIQSYGQAITDFLQGMNKCRGVIASRQFRGPGQLGWPRFRILELSEKRRRELVHRASLKPEVEENVIGQLGTAEHEIRTMASNPMFLGLLCEHMRAGNLFPENVHSIFETYLNMRLTRDETRLQRRFKLAPTEIRVAAEHVAFCMAAESGLGLSPTRQGIKDATVRLRMPLGRRFDVLLDALEYIKLARSETATAAGISKSFTFAHRRFQEYFATCVVLREPHRVSPQQLLTDARWRETAVVLCQTQPLEVLSLIIEEARRLLRELVNSVPGLIDQPLEYVSVPASIEQDTQGKQELLPEPFSWPNKAIHLLGLLQDGFRSRMKELPDDMRQLAGQLLFSADVTGTLSDRKWGLEVAGIAPPAILTWLIRRAFASRSQWLREIAYRQVARLGEIPADIARGIRLALLDLAANGRLHQEYHATQAHLTRLDQATHFLSVARLLSWLSPLDLILHLIAFFVLLSIKGWKDSYFWVWGIIALSISHLSFRVSLYRFVDFMEVSLVDFMEVSLVDSLRIRGARQRIAIYLKIFPAFTSVVLLNFTLAMLVLYARFLPMLIGLRYKIWLSIPIYTYVAIWPYVALFTARTGHFTRPLWWMLIPLCPFFYFIYNIRSYSSAVLKFVCSNWKTILRLLFLLLMYALIIYISIKTEFLDTILKNIIAKGVLIATAVLGALFMFLEDAYPRVRDWMRWRHWVKQPSHSIGGQEFLDLLAQYLTIRPINFPFPEFQAARRVKHLTLAVAGYPLVTLTGMSADAGFPRQRHA